MKAKSNIYNKNLDLDERIYSCRKIVIQSLQKTIHEKMFGFYVKDRRLESQIKDFRVNSSGGIIRVQFFTPQQAMNFYQERSFIDQLLIRKFNIYFDLSAFDQEVKRYFLRGIKEDNIRAVFEKCKQYGVVRMNILYGYNKMKDTCIFSYLRSQFLSEKDFDNLGKQLETLNVMLTHYKEKQGNESYIKHIQSEIVIQERYQQKQKQQKEQQHLIFFLTIHNQDQDEAKRNDKETSLKIKKIIQSEQERIWIQRLIIPTLNPSKNQIILLRQIELKKEKQAEQKFMKISQWLRVSNQDSIALFYSTSTISTLIINKPMNYMVKSKNGLLIIYLRTEQKEKLIKVAEIQYQQIEDFLFQQDKIKVSLYKSKQINVFGEYYQFNLEQDW